MTRRELCDPFGSDDEDETSNTCIENKVNNSKVVEVNGDIQSDGEKVENKRLSADITLMDLPKPNSVSINSLKSSMI